MTKSTCYFLGSMLGSTVAFQPAHAQDMKLGELKEKNAQMLSKDELNALLPESTYLRHTGKAVRDYWKNEPGGKLVGGRSCAGGAQARCSKPYEGTWRVRDDGAYCVETGSQTDDDTARWCRYIWKVGNDYYGVTTGKPNDSRTGFKFSLDK